jgi:hypothetical protein
MSSPDFAGFLDSGLPSAGREFGDPIDREVSQSRQGFGPQALTPCAQALGIVVFKHGFLISGGRPEAVEFPMAYLIEGLELGKPIVGSFVRIRRRLGYFRPATIRSIRACEKPVVARISRRATN